MTSTDVGRTDINRDERERVSPAEDRAYARPPDYDSGRSRRVRMTTAKETRRSFITTEFWLTLLGAAAVVTAGYWDEARLAVDLAWALGIGLVAMYVLSRGIAKAGSQTHPVRDERY
jgi:hypothetical protein